MSIRAREQHADSDAALLGAIAVGDRDALGELYDRHAGRLLAISLAILRDRSDAEDLVHDVFLEAWQKARSYDPQKGSVIHWLILRTRSRAIDRLRALAVREAYRRRERSDADPHEADRVDAVDVSLLTDSLTLLPDGQRQVIELMYFRGHTCREVARALRIPLGTVKSRLSTALARLRVRYSLAGGVAR